jgi:hypothetical protein
VLTGFSIEFMAKISEFCSQSLGKKQVNHHDQICGLPQKYIVNVQHGWTLCANREKA